MKFNHQRTHQLYTLAPTLEPLDFFFPHGSKKMKSFFTNWNNSYLSRSSKKNCWCLMFWYFGILVLWLSQENYYVNDTQQSVILNE